jgi:hypothetical protein
LGLADKQFEVEEWKGAQGPQFSQTTLKVRLLLPFRRASYHLSQIESTLAALLTLMLVRVCLCPDSWLQHV